MNRKLRPVPMGEMIASADSNEVLVVYGLGSCVVICLYDPLAKVGGILHAMLPDATQTNSHNSHLTKFVDEGVPMLINAVIALGARRTRLITRLCGGARMITRPGFNDTLNIGERNVLTAQMALQAAGLKVQTQAIGGYVGRTIKFYLADGRVTIRTLGQEEHELI